MIDERLEQWMDRKGIVTNTGFGLTLFGSPLPGNTRFEIVRAGSVLTFVDYYTENRRLNILVKSPTTSEDFWMMFSGTEEFLRFFIDAGSDYPHDFEQYGLMVAVLPEGEDDWQLT